MHIAFHGVRGSYPTPGPNTTLFGGNTTCVSIWKEVEGKIKRIIIDCGTGVIPLGKKIVENYFAGKEDLNPVMLFTHLHPDHTQGFPFFAPNFFPQCNLALMGMKTLRQHVGIVLERGMLPPTFPIEYKDLKSTRKHFELRDGQIFYIKKDMSIAAIACAVSPKALQDEFIFRVEVMQAFAPSHPQQGCLYYKITDLENLKSIACIWDLESHAGGDRRGYQLHKRMQYYDS